MTLSLKGMDVRKVKLILISAVVILGVLVMALFLRAIGYSEKIFFALWIAALLLAGIFSGRAVRKFIDKKKKAT